MTRLLLLMAVVACAGCAQVALMLECGPFPMSLDACIDHDEPQPAQPPWSGVKWI